MAHSSCSSRCPVMICLFFFLAWLELVSSYLGFHLHKLHQSPAESFQRKVEEDINQTVLRSSLQSRILPSILSNKSPSTLLTDRDAEPLPWSSSLQPSRELSYMPMFIHQLSIVNKRKMRPVSVDERLAYQASHVKPARIGNTCYECEKFRKVRMTYFDAGDAVQVFNTVWYPRYEYDLPMLGIDLISLGRGRVLTVIDLQPLHPTAAYASKYISPLEGIRAKYPDLQGSLSGKIYTDTSFFSSQMLFGRFTDEAKLSPVVYPAFTEYLQAYLQMMDQAVPDPTRAREVLERQRAYDCYSALKDPAVGLFDAYFGKEWSKDFVHDFLFSLSDKDEASSAVHNFKVEQGVGSSVGSSVGN